MRDRRVCDVIKLPIEYTFKGFQKKHAINIAVIKYILCLFPIFGATVEYELLLQRQIFFFADNTTQIGRKMLLKVHKQIILYNISINFMTQINYDINI